MAIRTAQIAPCLQENFIALDAMAQADLVRRGEVSPLELVDAAIARIESLNPQINALASSDFALARGKALAASSHGVLAAVPTLIKDLLAYPGLRLERGSRLFKGHMAEVISPYAEALGRAGLIALGKTTTSELGLLGTTETLACGATRNPWDLSRSSGGSSGGAAAAVASGMVPVAHASDGGGSIRGPGSFCGLFGFKPSRGRTLAADVPPTLPTAGLLSEHCLSRSVRDSAAWLAITERNDPEAPFAPLGMLTEPPRNRLRIGVYRQDVFGRDPEPAALAALEHACRLCREIGHEIVEVAAPRYAPDAPKNAFFLLTGAVLAGTFDFLQQAMGPAFRPELAEPYTLELIRRAAQSSPAQLVQAQKALASGQLIAEQSMASFDLLLCPTVADVAFPLQRYRPTDAADKLIAFTESVAGYTVIASVAGWPAMSIPLYRNADGLPLGSHFAAPCGREDLLFGLAYQLEQAADWGNDWPDLLAEV